jgi:hypothetical protein
MNREHLPRQLLIVFLVTFAVYAAGFWFIEGRRKAQSPWIVSYKINATGHTTLEIHQQSLALGPVEIRFASATTNALMEKTQITYNDPKPVPRPAPIGQCMFEDLTFLPGTVALKIHNQHIQMLPRTLSIGTNEFLWGRARIIRILDNGACEVVE